MKQLLPLLFLLLTTGWSHAQTTPVQKFEKFFEFSGDFTGNTKHTVNRDLHVDSSGIYFFGNTVNFTRNDVSTVVSKFNYDGTMQWNKVWRSPGLLNGVYGANCIVPQEDGFTIIGADANIFIRDSMFLYNPFLLKINRNGDSVRLTKHEEDSVHDRIIYSTCAGTNGSIYAIGNWGGKERTYDQYKRLYVPDKVSLYLVKYDDTGAIVWERNFWETNLFQYNNATPSKIVRSPSGDLYMCGRVHDTLLNRPGNYYLKLDSNGNILWRRSYPNSSYEFYGSQEVIPHPDGGFYYAYTGTTLPAPPGGNSAPNNSLFCYGRCKANGDTLWTRIYADTGQVGGFKESFVINLELGKKGELRILGNVFYNAYLHPTLLVVDTNGSIKYKREYYPYPGGILDRFLLHSASSPYNTLIFSGSTVFNSTIPGVVDTLGAYGWMMQTDSLGCLTAGCNAGDTVWHYGQNVGLAEVVSALKEVQLYPNPTTGTFYLKDLPASGCNYLLLDATGRTLRMGSLTQTREAVHIADLPAGLYLLQLRDPKGSVQAFKVMKE